MIRGLWLCLVATFLSACTLQTPALTTSPETDQRVISQEVGEVSVEVASALSADIVGVLKGMFPPAKNRWVFLPPDAVFGHDLRDRLRSAGYGIAAQRSLGMSELSYTLDQIGQQWRLGVRLGSWRIDRLYGVDADHSTRWRVVASGTSRGSHHE